MLSNFAYFRPLKIFSIKQMKNSLTRSLLVIYIGLFALVNNVNGQVIQSWGQKMTKKLSVTGQFGLLHSWGDFREDEIMPAFTQLSENEFGGGLLLNYHYSKIFTLSTGITAGQLSGKQNEINTTGALNEPRDLGKGILFNTTLLELTFPRIDVNLTRLIFRDKIGLFNKLSVNLFASHGLVFYDSKIYAQSDESVNLLYSKKRGRTGKTVEAVTSGGLNLTYILSDRFDISVESSLRSVWNDKLDAWITDGSANDAYSYSAIGLTYYIKKRGYVIKDFDLEEEQLADKDGEQQEPIEDIEEEKTAIENKEPANSSSNQGKIEDKKPPVDPLDEPIVQKPVDDKKDIVEELEQEIEEVDETTDETASSTPSSSDDASDVYQGDGKFIIVAAFRTLERSRKMVELLKEKGENPIIVRNRIDTWYLIAIDRYDDKATALGKMKEARAAGYKSAWVFLKPLE